MIHRLVVGPKSTTGNEQIGLQLPASSLSPFLWITWTRSNSSPCFRRTFLWQQYLVENLPYLFLRLVTAIFDLFSSDSTDVSYSPSLRRSIASCISSLLSVHFSAYFSMLFSSPSSSSFVFAWNSAKTFAIPFLVVMVSPVLDLRDENSLFLLIWHSICSSFLQVLPRSFEYVLVLSSSFFLWCIFWSSCSLHECVPSHPFLSCFNHVWGPGFLRLYLLLSFCLTWLLCEGRCWPKGQTPHWAKCTFDLAPRTSTWKKKR